MKNLKNIFSQSMMVLIFALTFSACEETAVEPNETKTGQASFEITDGPIDDKNVESAFVTIAEIKIDGKTYEGFNGKQTIDLLAYQNGNTKALGLGELEVGTYSEISLVLDYETSMNGEAPGCYVLTTDGVKHELSAAAMGSKELVLNNTMTVKEDTETRIVFDFDLRKAITYTQNSSSQSDFQFVTDAELENSVRMLNKEQTGQVKGQASKQMSSMNYGDKVVAYIYKKGTFDIDVESKGQGQSQIEFLNAETSAVLDANGNYTLAFLEEGDYEIHFISYEDTNNDGQLEIKGSVDISSNSTIDFNNISVNAGASLSLDVLFLTILPL